MHSNFLLIAPLALTCLFVFSQIGQSLSQEELEIHGYHFHTYFFQTNERNTQEALAFRDAIQNQIDNGFLGNCRLNRVNLAPVGPHPIGSYETCCNKTSISPALTFFMENHGNLSILLHPLTRYEVMDHTHRAMFLGEKLPLDVSVLSEDLAENLDLCLPIPSGNDINAV
ncbi:unnamed protein product [Orchesella dallaii]|uniref:DOPA 4,5-dioxygenase n=1 Tax=Orchesella dallaii TaxID=48710 RepID=A0ABP1PQI1_9HEXA